MKVTLRLLERRDEGGGVVSFRFRPNELLAHRAGQFVRLTVPHADPDERGDSRYFTIASAPSEPFLMIATRVASPGSSFKCALAALPIGQIVDATGPSGRFTYPDEQRPALFIGGGIGVTPFRAMLVDLASRAARSDVALLYASRTPDIPFRDQFDRLPVVQPNLSVVYTVTHPTEDWRGLVGRLTRHCFGAARGIWANDSPSFPDHGRWSRQRWTPSSRWALRRARSGKRSSPATNPTNERSAIMCLNCGCNMPDDNMGNPDNLTMTDLAKAAKASEMNGADTLANLRTAFSKIDPQHLDRKIKELGS